MADGNASAPVALAPPAGFSVPGSRGDAAPGSMLAQLRKDARRKQEARTVTVELPAIGDTPLRATYGSLSIEEIERFSESVANTAAISQNLELLARACRKIEAQDQDGKWWVLEDDAGPVTFDDRLTRLLGWDRPDQEFRYPVAQVWEGMFAGDGFALIAHTAKVTTALGLADLEVGPGESTSGGPTRSEPPPRSGSTPRR